MLEVRIVVTFGKENRDPAPFVEETVFSPLCILGALTENQLIVYMRIYFWAFYFVPLIYMSVFMLVPYCYDDYSFVQADLILLCFVLLYFTDTVFFKNYNPALSKYIGIIFPIVFSHFVCSHFGNSHNFSNPPPVKRLWLTKDSDGG